MSYLYRQVSDSLRSDILRRVYSYKEPLPSIRCLSERLDLSNLTISKAYHVLISEGIVFKKRGVGFFINAHNVESLMSRDLDVFWNVDFPMFVEKARVLNVDLITILSEME